VAHQTCAVARTVEVFPSDKAFSLSEKGYQDRSVFMGYMKSFPWFDSLRSDPRHAGLLHRMNPPL
jgi:hypothetical protein